MELMEFETEKPMSREEAAAVLHRLADELARHNEVAFTQSGTQFRVKVPDQVRVELEVEIGDESSLEVEIKW